MRIDSWCVHDAGSITVARAVCGSPQQQLSEFDRGGNHLLFAVLYGNVYMEITLLGCVDTSCLT